MIDLSKAMSYEEFLKRGTDEERALYASVSAKARISSDFAAAVDAVSRERHLVAFSEVFCPDSAILMPFLLRASKNPKIHLYLFPRTGNEKEMESLFGAARIPSVAVYDENHSLLGRYVEFPMAVLDILILCSPKDRELTIAAHRSGQFCTEIELDLKRLLAGRPSNG